jgi:stage III sporulation protein AD
MEIASKAAVLGAVAACAALLIKKSNPELAFALSAAVTACICAAAIKLMSSVISVVREAVDFSGLSPAIFSPVLKCTAICIIAKISADMCRDASQSGAASAVELAGSAAALFTALPLLETLMKMAGGLT